MVVPKDEGIMMFNFALAPGELQPSGHFNVSRAREFYMELSSDIIGVPPSGSSAV